VELAQWNPEAIKKRLIKSFIRLKITLYIPQSNWLAGAIFSQFSAFWIYRPTWPENAVAELFVLTIIPATIPAALERIVFRRQTSPFSSPVALLTAPLKLLK
jgi:hypothetical protein